MGFVFKIGAFAGYQHGYRPTGYQIQKGVSLRNSLRNRSCATLKSIVSLRTSLRTSRARTVFELLQHLLQAICYKAT